MKVRAIARRVLLAAAAGLVVVVAVGLWMLPEVVRRVAIRGLEAATDRTVTLDAVELRLRDGHVALRGLRVLDPDGSALATIERVDARFRPRALLRAHVHIDEATVRGLGVHVVRTGPRTFNISHLFAPASDGESRIAATVERFTIADGVVEVEDRTPATPRAWRVEKVSLEARHLSTVAGAAPGAAELTALVAGAPLSLAVTDLTLTPLRLRGTLTARDLDASLAGLALPPAVGLDPPRGTVSVSATLEQEPSAGARVSLDVTAAGIELRRAGEARPFLATPGLRVTVADLRAGPGGLAVGHVLVDGSTLFLEDARLGRVQRWRVDDLDVEARNLSTASDAAPGVAEVRGVMGGARLAVYATNIRLAPLALHATAIVRDVDATLLRLYLPATLPVRLERGVVHATVRVDHSEAAGTRLAMDAEVNQLQVRRLDHVVRAPEVRVVATDIAFADGAVTVGHVVVDGDRLAVEERTGSAVRTWVFRDLDVEAKALSSRPGDLQGIATVNATIAGARASAWITRARLDPLELNGTVILRDVDLAMLRVYVPTDVPVRPMRGVVNASFQVEHTAAAGTRVVSDASFTGVEVRGRGATETLAVTAPALRVTVADARHRGTDLSLGRIEVTGSATVDDAKVANDRLDLADLRVTTEGVAWPAGAPGRVDLSARFRDRGALSASGSVRLTAAPPAVAFAAELDLQLTGVDLTALPAYVPAARGVGGRVRATLTASVAYDGALTGRVRGDLGGVRYAMVEGDRTLLTARRVDATGLDVEWPARVTVAQVRVRQPFVRVERDRDGRVSVPQPAGAGAAQAPAGLAVTVGELIVEDGSAAVTDASTPVPVRLELPDVDLTVRDVTWPLSKPVAVRLDVALPRGGRAQVEGTVTAEPASVDVKVTVKDADLAVLQPYLPFRAKVGARADATLTVAGPLVPTPRLTVRGDAGLRNIVISDAQRPLITVARLEAAGIDALWPERVSVDRVRVRRSWAHLERDRQGGFPLQALLEQPPGTPSLPASGPSPAPALAFRLREGIFEQQAATIVDATLTPAARFEVTGARLVVHEFTWPARGPMKVDVTAPMPGSGQLQAAGTVDLATRRLDLRTVLTGVSLEPARPYVPIEGRLAGQVTGELAVKLALEPFGMQVAGAARVDGFTMSDGTRPVVTAGRVDAAGIDVDWPRRVALSSVHLRRARLLVERDRHGAIRLRQLVTPQWPAVGGAPTAAGQPVAVAPLPAAPIVEIATLTLDRASARLVDHTTTPAFGEEVSSLDAVVTGISTAPERRARFTASGTVGGGVFKASGEASYGPRLFLDAKVALRDFIVPRANPYLQQFTAWTATQGSIDVTGAYTLNGAMIDARTDVHVRDLDVARVDQRDEVERRLGLPFGFLVALLEDHRGEIRLSLPVSGDLSTGEFNMQEAVWSGVRAVAIRVLALPFSRIGSLFVSQDSKVRAVAVAPVMFEAGTARPGPTMAAHLARVAEFLRATPGVSVVLQPIFVQGDLEQLQRDGASVPMEALHTLGTQRIELVRQEIRRAANIEAQRLAGRVPRTPLVESAGAARVEFDLKY